MRKTLLLLIVLVAGVLVACEPTGDDATDDLSAQNLQPALTGYQTTDLDVATDALFTAAGGAATVSGNVPLVAAIQRGDALLGCLQDTGSVSGLMYLQENPGIIPEVGASLVVNKTRVQRNLFDCITDTGFEAQTITELCSAYGEFSQDGEDFWFAYVGAGSGLCVGFETYYNNLGATFIDQYPPVGADG
ncbi:MAG: hypothetical protein AAFR81_01195 [Chloroflexota bacterium]